MQRKAQEAPLADDLLDGVAAIAAFTGWDRARVYRAAPKLPLFKFQGRWQARKSRLLRYIEQMEDRNAAE